MPSKELERLFHALTSAFPQADIMMFSASGIIMFSRRRLYILQAKYYNVTESISATTASGSVYYLISLFLPDGSRLLMCLQAGDYKSPSTALSMVLSLEQAIFCGNARPFPVHKADKFSLFIRQLLMGAVHDEQSLVAVLANELEVDLSIPRVISVLRFPALPGEPRKKQELISSALDLIHSLRSAGPHDLIGEDEDFHILLCREIMQSTASVKSQCSSYFSQIQEQLAARFGRRPQIGVGFVVSSQYEYAHGYTAARQVLQYSADSPSNISFAMDHIIELILDNSPPDILKHFLGEDAQLISENPTLLQTVEALVNCNMNMTEAAAHLYIHRNTMVLRLKQIRAKLDMDPIKYDNDRYILQLLLDYYKHHQ